MPLLLGKFRDSESGSNPMRSANMFQATGNPWGQVVSKCAE